DFGGRLDGEFNSQNHRFNLVGQLHACIVDVVCGQAFAVVSSQGAGGCVSVGSVSIGGGVQWARVGSPYIWPLDGCKWSRFTEDNVYGASHRRDGASQPSYVVHVKAGSTGEAVQLNGSGGAPDVTVKAPNGETLASPSGAGLAYSSDDHLRIMRSEQLDTTVVGLQNPAPGSYTITPAADSPTITSSSHAMNAAKASMSATVTGSG